jgi:phage terminase large subunit
MKAEVRLPQKLVDLFTGEADARIAFGGRGSGKTRGFALMTAVRAYMWAAAGESGIILCLRQFMNSLDDSSLEEVKQAIRGEEWLAPHFEIGEKYIRTAGHLPGRIDYSFAGLSRNINSLKSKARIRIGWADEAEDITDEAWTKLVPTLREEDSELWVTYNPESDRSATHKRFRLSSDPRYKVVEVNYSDNPFFPDTLERQRLRDLAQRPDQYEHIWEGGFKKVTEGAYFAADLTRARQERRIGHVPADPLMRHIAFWDIGGTGANADACSIWVCQWIGASIRFIDYYEAQGQPLAAHINWLRENGHGHAICVLPHDGVQNDRVFAVSYDSALKDAGFDVTVIKNQGRGAALLRVNAMRRLFGMMMFDETRCKAGLDALGHYHEKRDAERGVGLGPNHDWASHAADAAGLVAIAYEQNRARQTPVSEAAYDDNDGPSGGY